MEVCLGARVAVVMWSVHRGPLSGQPLFGRRLCGTMLRSRPCPGWALDGRGGLPVEVCTVRVAEHGSGSEVPSALGGAASKLCALVPILSAV